MTVGLLAAHLTPENHRELLDMARHKTKRAVEELVARLRPLPPVPPSVRKLPTGSHSPAAPLVHDDVAAGSEATSNGQGIAAPDLPCPTMTPSPARPALIVPLAPERYKIQFTANAETYEKIRLAQDLLRHQIPDGDPAKIFDRALTALLQDLAKKKLAATGHPRKGRRTMRGSHHIPADVKRTVWLRDRGRCAFVGKNGRRCTEQGFLEFHHVVPHGAGGAPTADNIQLRCRAHNSYEAELFFGPRNPLVMREMRASYISLTEQLHPRARLVRPYGSSVRTQYRVGPSRLSSTSQQTVPNHTRDRTPKACDSHGSYLSQDSRVVAPPIPDSDQVEQWTARISGRGATAV